MKTLVAWSRNSALVALALVMAACQGESPTIPPATGGGGGNPPPTNSTIVISVSNPNPFVSSTTTVTATVTIAGAAAPNGTAVEFSTDFGVFEDSGTNASLRTTTGGVATVVLTSATAGTARITVRVNTVANSASVTFKDRPVEPPPPDTALAITTMTPDNGKPEGNEIITLTGRNIREPVRVVFDNVEARVLSVTSTEIRVASPTITLGATEQAREVTVTVFGEAGTPNEQRAIVPVKFRYQISILTPNVFAVSPSSGPNEGNTRITITGEGFQSPVKVFFSVSAQTELQVLTVNYNQIVAMTPPASGLGADLANKEVTLRVQNVASNTSSTLAQAFRYGPVIDITGFEPTDGSFFGGTRVTIFGFGFDDPVSVTVGGVPAQVIRVSGTEITVITNRKTDLSGCGSLAAGPIVVTNLEEPSVSGTATSKTSFAYKVPQATIISVTPSPVVQGSTATIVVKGAGPGDHRFVIGGVTLIPTSTSASGELTTFTVIVPATLMLDEEDCGNGGKRYINTTYDVTFTNVTSLCSDTLADGITVSPSDVSCRIGPDASLRIDRTNYLAAVGLTQTGTLTVTNVGTQDLVITAIAISDAEFSITSGPIPTTLVPGASQAYTVTYAPTDVVPDAAEITVTTNDPTPPDAVMIQGNANQPDAAVSISKVNYVADIGGTDTGTLTITNIGLGPLTISSISVSDNEFTVTGVIPTTIAPAASAAFTVTYAPTDTASDSAAITITSNDPTPPAAINVTGTTNAPDAAVSITRTDFSACVGTTQAATLTIVNAGAGPLTVTAISLTDSEFSITSGAIPTTPIAAAGSRTFTVTYAPTDAIPDSATLTITSNDPTPPAGILLTGKADPQNTGVDVTKVSFNTCIGGTPDDATLTVTNTGCGPLLLTAVTVNDAEFSVLPLVPGTSLPRSIAVAGTSTFRIRYAPTDSVTDNALITVVTDDPTPPDPIVIQGVSAPADAGVEITKTNFTSCIGATDTATLTVSNLGCAPLTISAITSSDGEFNIDSTLPVTIPAGMPPVAFIVTYSPADSIQDNATITVTTNDPTPPPGIAVTGTSAPQDAGVVIDDTTLEAEIGATDTATLRVTNLGCAPLNVTGVTSTDSEFFVPSFGPVTIAVGAFVDFTVTYAPVDEGTDFTTITVSSNDPTPPPGIAVEGRALVPNAAISANPTVYSAPIGGSQVGQFTVTNSGTADLMIGSLTSSDSEFVLSGAIPPSLAPGASVNFVLTYTPTDTIADSANINITSNDPSPPAAIVVTGTVPPPDAVLSITSTTFLAPLGGSDSKVLTVTNNGGSSLVITSVTFGGPGPGAGEFSATPLLPITALPDSVAPGGTKTFTITYTPVDLTADSPTLTVTTNDPTPPAGIVLQGSASPPNAALAITGSVFSAPLSGTDARTLTVNNTGGSSLTITSITFSGGETEFTATPLVPGTALPTSVAAGGMATFTITYTPTDTVADSTDMAVITNDPTPPAPISISGSVPPNASWSVPAGTLAPGGSATITISNVGGGSLNVTNVTLSGAEAGEFFVTGAFPFNIAAGASNATVTVTYAPTDIGPDPDTAMLSLASNDGSPPAALTINGFTP